MRPHLICIILLILSSESNLENLAQPHDRINFNLRPNKRIERRLIAEALMCIYRYDTPRRFGYIGMGSYYFSDFVLFHKIFGIENMVSIEYDIENRKRFEFNKPFDCIDMVFGTTHDVLDSLKIFSERPVICWLDYYDRLTQAILGDIQTALTRAQVGSAIIVTLKAGAFNKLADVEKFMLGLPPELRSPQNRALLSSSDGMRNFMHAAISARIEVVLSALNEESKNPLEAKQIFNMSYRDGVAMVTFGWLLLDKKRRGSLEVEPNAFDAPGFSIAESDHLDIATPNLTFREIAHLKSLLPNGPGLSDFKKNALPITEGEAKKFAKFYRYHPNFADTEE